VERILGLIAGNGKFPLLVAENARNEGIDKIVAVAFYGDTSEEINQLADEVTWIYAGELGKLIKAFRGSGVKQALMAGQLTPTVMFKKLRFDWRMIKLFTRLKNRKANTIFGAIADELEGEGVHLINSTLFLNSHLPDAGLLTKRKLSKREEEDVAFGTSIAKEIGRLDIGQTVVVKSKAVIAVEGIDGTDATIRRGGELVRKDVVVIKTAKPNQDMRFDVPVVGLRTIETMIQAKAKVLAVEAKKTLFLEKDEIIGAANRAKISIVAFDEVNSG